MSDLTDTRSLSAPRGATRLRLKQRDFSAEGILALTFTRDDGGRLPDWTPGSHIDLILPNGESRQYSLCGDPFDSSRYDIAVLRDDAGRGGSKFIHDELVVGATVGFGGPRNNFRLVPSDRYSFIAGGVGITPIVPMVEQADHLGLDWHLLYLGRSAPSMALRDRLTRFGERLTLHPSISDGRADVAAWIGEERADTKVYVCGPESLTSAVQEHTRAWRRGWVRTERFTAAKIVTTHTDSEFDVFAATSGRLVRVSPTESVTTALRRAGVDILTSCSRGVCGTCATAVLAGTPEHRDSLLDDDERAANTSMFPCVSRSVSDQLTLAI